MRSSAISRLCPLRYGRWVDAPRRLTPPDPPLTDGVVTLRAFRDTDADAIVAMMDEPEIARWTRAPSPYRLEDAIEWLAKLPAAPVRGDLPLAVVDAGTDELVGNIAVHLGDDGRGEFGYAVAARARRRGVASRALRLYARWAFEELGLARLEVHTRPANAVSIALAERVGFKREGVLRSYTVIRGERSDVVMLSLLPGELR
jgi:RimJ/RimL family protein N-acetyltransferase